MVLIMAKHQYLVRQGLQNAKYGSAKTNGLFMYQRMLLSLAIAELF
jgi:hypothetical protein